jgi:hypothetical protein
VGCEAGADRIAFSPRGTAVALYHSDSGMLQVVRGLPGAPAALPAVTVGPAEVLAASDDGSAAAVGAAGAVTIFTADGASSTFPYTAAALAFLPARQDLLIADAGAGQVTLVRDATAQVLAASLDPVALAVSDDGARVFVADRAGGIVTIGIDSGELTFTPTMQPASGFYRLRGDSLFRVTELAAGPAWIFDGGASGPRMLFIPAAQEERSGQ